MRSIFKITLFTIFCGLFLMQSAVLAQKDSTAGSPNEDLEIQFPVVEGWEKGDTTVFPSPELGYSIGYKSEEGNIVTIYVYNGGLKKISDDINDKVVKSQMEKAKNEIKQAGKLGYYDKVKEVTSDTVMLGGSSGKLKTLHSQFTFTVREVDVISEIYLFTHQNHFIKIRVTSPAGNEDTENKALNNLFTKIEGLFSE